MPMDRSKYPKDWPKISKQIRFERAKGRCEWCNAPHGGFRDDDGLWFEPEFAETFPHMAQEMIKIVLTTAHLGIDKLDGTPGDKADTMDCRPENLAALCQRCHLNFDRTDHINNRRRNRRLWLVDAGQIEMF